MNNKKIITGTLAVVFGLIIISFILFSLWWNGAFTKVIVQDIASYDSPDGNYCLKYQQLGEPEWPFGKTDVRLTLYDRNNKKVNSIDTFIQADGCLAHEGNIKSIEWTNDSVLIILQASEMDDKEIEIFYQE